MTAKTDTKKLVGILEEFEFEDVEGALQELAEGDFKQMSTHEFPDPGEEVEAGEDAHCEFDELSDFERIILVGGNNLLPVAFLEEGAMVQRAVARVVIPGLWRGTGFMVSRSLFLTNNHVLPDVAKAKKARIEFNYQLDYQGNAQTLDSYTLDPNDVFYTNAGLDFTLVRVRPRCRWLYRPVVAPQNGGELQETYGEVEAIVGMEPSAGLSTHDTTGLIEPSVGIPGWPPQPIRLCTYAGQRWGWLRLRATIQMAKRQHLNIVQHPRARRKEVAIQDNTISKVFTSMVHYTTDTEPGSSGSPVFNNAWDLIALHHAAGEQKNGQWISNEGVRIDRIAADIRNQYTGTPAGAAILAELGL